MIPHKIYRTWRTNDLPIAFQKAWNFTRKHNPYFEQVLYTDKDVRYFMYKYYKNHSVWSSAVYDAFNSINPIYHAARADLFRYALLYEKGGIYLDIKSTASNISQILNNNSFLYSPWEWGLFRIFSIPTLRTWDGEYQQWWFAAAPKHKVTKKIIDDVLGKIHNYQYNGSYEKCQMIRKSLGESILTYLLFLNKYCISFDVLKVTGPYVFTNAISSFSNIKPLQPNGNGHFIYDFTGRHRKDTSYLKNTYWNIGDRLILKKKIKV